MEQIEGLAKLLREKNHEKLKESLNDIYEYVLEADAERDSARALVRNWNKDEELQKLNAEIERLKREKYKAFIVSAEERAEIETWKAAHIKEHPKCGGSHGAIGGNWAYEFVPTSIGDIGTIKCSCGAEFVFKELC